MSTCHGQCSTHAGRSSAAQNAAGATIVAVMGVVLIALAVSGQLNSYLRPAFRPWEALTGLALFALATWTLIGLRGGEPSERGHDHPLRKTSWALLVPLVIAVVVAPAPLNSSMINTAGGSVGVGAARLAANSQQAASRVGRNADGTIAYEPLSADSASEISLEDLANRFTFGRKADLEGKEITVVGFLSPAETEMWQINRFKIYCCAADAIPYNALLVDGTITAEADDWYEITATVDALSSDLTPILHITSATPISQPETPYL